MPFQSLITQILRRPAEPTAAVYIDTDNQSPLIAPGLIAAMGAVGKTVSLVCLAGNAKGESNRRWAEGLRQAWGEADVCSRVVPSTEDAADVALILALGENLKVHIQAQTLIVIVSRDGLLLKAACDARAQGGRVVMAYAAGTCSLPISVPTWLLPPPKENRQTKATSARSHQKTPERQANQLSSCALPIPEPPDQEVVRAIRYIVEHANAAPAGGYYASSIGHFLGTKGLGYTEKADRERLIARFPGLWQEGSGPDKILHFQTDL